MSSSESAPDIQFLRGSEFDMSSVESVPETLAILELLDGIGTVDTDMGASGVVSELAVMLAVVDFIVLLRCGPSPTI